MLTKTVLLLLYVELFYNEVVSKGFSLLATADAGSSLADFIP
jgi:hypothetical protein